MITNRLNLEFPVRPEDSSRPGEHVPGEILIVAASRVNRIVVESTVRRMGRPCRALDFTTLTEISDTGRPDLVIFDCSGRVELCRDFTALFNQQIRPKLMIICGSESIDGIDHDMVLRKPVIADRLEEAILALLPCGA